MKRAVILCVDDERIILNSLKAQLLNNLHAQFRIELAESAEEALEIVDELTASRVELPVVIADQIMPGMKGDALLAIIKERLPDTLTIMLTGQATAEAIGKAVNKAGLFRYLAKPWEEDDLILTVQSALATYQQQKALFKQSHYQKVINEILLLALKPMEFQEQVAMALQRLLDIPCFTPPSLGAAYFSAENPVFKKSSTLSDIELNADQHYIKLTEVGSTAFPDALYVDTLTQSEKVEYREDKPHEAFKDAAFLGVPYYQCRVIVHDKTCGLLFIFVNNEHCHTELIVSFLSSFCHTLSNMIILAESNYALSESNRELLQHKLELESLVRSRTQELECSLKALEENNRLLNQANKELAYYAATDSLTGLANRRSFFEQARNSFISKPAHEPRGCIAMVDLDFFKEINDTNGHQAGDQVLVTIAKTITDSLQETMLVGRVGGEEFAIYMPDSSLQSAIETCSRLLEEIAQTRIDFEGMILSVTGSIGLSEVQPQDKSIEQAVNRADKALYESKHRGRNTLCTYDEQAASDNSCDHGNTSC